MVQAPSPLPIHPDDPDDDWVTATNIGRAVRVRFMTGGLILLAVLAGGFWGGVVAEKHHGSGASTTSAATRFSAAARAAGAGGGGFALGGAGGAGTAGGSFTTGTVIDVQGTELDISDSSGNIVRIDVGPATTVTRTAKTPLSGLQIGDTVVVAGSTGAGGRLSATSIRASGQGVGPTGGSAPAGGG